MKNIQKNKFYIILIIIGLLMVSVVSCKKKSDKKTTTAAAPQKVSVAKPIVKPIVLYRLYPGYIQSNATINLVARVSGYLTKQNYNAGQAVKEGDLLFVIEPTLYQNQVDQAKANLNSAKATLDYNNNNYQRMQEAAKSDAISQIDLIQAETNVNTAKASVKSAEAALKTAETNLGYCYVKAPMSGYMSINQIDVGNYVAGAASPVTLATLYNNDPMYAYFSIEDNQYMLMRVTSKDETWRSTLPKSVTINMSEGTFPAITAKPDYLSPNVDLSTGTLNLRAVIDNAKWQLKSGMFCTVSLPYGEDNQAILIQDASTGTDQLGRFIYIVNNQNEVEYRHIEVGQIVDDTLIQVTSGLSPDERYVTKAMLKVRSGMKVEPIN